MDLENLPFDPLRSYGGRSLHEQSHGESFLAILVHRFGPNGLYLLRTAAPSRARARRAPT